MDGKIRERAAKGTGTIERLPSGRYRYKLVIAGQAIRGVRDSEAEARAELDAVLHHLTNEGLGSAGALTLGQWGARWLAQRTNRNAEDDRNRWRRHLAGSALAELPVAEITRRDCKQWLMELGRRRALVPAAGGKRIATRRSLSEQTQKHCLNLLRGTLAAAVDEGFLTTNPAAGLRVQAPAQDSAQLREHLEPAQVQALLHQPLTLDVRAAFTLACFGGLRPGEMIALQWPDVHLDCDRPHVVVRRSHGGTTKTGKARVVPLLEPARAALIAWKAIAPPSRADWVWPSRRHGGRHAKGYDWGWADHCSRAGRPVTLGWRSKAGMPASNDLYSLRHTCATALLQGWWGEPWRVEEVRALLGHTSVKTTEIYAHQTASHLLETARRTHSGMGAAGSAGPEQWPAATVVSATVQVHDKSTRLVSIEPLPSARPAGIEPAAHGLEGRWAGQAPCGVTPDRGPVVDLSRRLLLQVANGQPVPGEWLDELAAVALAQAEVQLAQVVRAGGPHVQTRAIELASAVLTGAAKVAALSPTKERAAAR